MAKRPEAILVDAHNLLHRHPLGPGLRRDAETMRRALEDRLAGRKRIHLFYDGGPNGLAARSVRHGLQLHYSGAGSADDDIVGWLNRHQNQRVQVVTADGDLRRRCQVRGATVLHPDAFNDKFLRELDQPADRNRGAPPAHEVDEWLDVFGDEAY